MSRLRESLESALNQGGFHHWGLVTRNQLESPGVQALVEVEAVRRHAAFTQGRAGEMTWIAPESAQDARKAFDPSPLLPQWRSLIIVAVPYAVAGPLDSQSIPRGSQSAPPGQGRIARYGQGRDYHRHLVKGLDRALGTVLGPHTTKIPVQRRYRTLADSHPLDERWFGWLSGLGFVGKNRLFIVPGTGSWYSLALALVAEDLGESQRGLLGTEEPRQLHGPGHPKSCPSSCERCLSICPTAALTSPNTMDVSRCISYLTIEHQGPIDEPLMEAMGEWVFGCDLCQEVCPLNLKRELAQLRGFTEAVAGDQGDLEWLITCPDYDSFLARYAGSPLMRPGWIMMKRNSVIAATNGDQGQLLPQIRAWEGLPCPTPGRELQWEGLQRAITWSLSTLGNHQ